MKFSSWTVDKYVLKTSICDTATKIFNWSLLITKCRTVVRKLYSLLLLHHHTPSLYFISPSNWYFDTLSVHTITFEGLYSILNTFEVLYSILNTLEGLCSILNTFEGIYGILNTFEGLYSISNTFEGLYSILNTFEGLYSILNTFEGLYSILNTLEGLLQHIKYIGGPFREGVCIMCVWVALTKWRCCYQ